MEVVVPVRVRENNLWLFLAELPTWSITRKLNQAKAKAPVIGAFAILYDVSGLYISIFRKHRLFEP
jgi:hypothetical protein